MVSSISPSVLLVEDNPADAWLVRLLFEEIAGPDLDLSTVEDGVAALAYLRREQPQYAGAKRPDLVLLDLNLPLKDGRQVLREIREDPGLCQLPVVIFSSSDAEDDIRPCYELKANDYVVKQADLEGQMEALRTIHQRWLGKRRRRERPERARPTH